MKLSAKTAIIISAASICIFALSCSVIYKPLIKANSLFSFNYPGLRFETRASGPKTGENNIICLGDSVTFGWNLKYVSSYPQLLDKKISEEGYSVYNFGIGGDTVIDGLKRLERDVIDNDPDMVIVNFGLNDGMLIETENSCSDEFLINYNSQNYCPIILIEDFEVSYSKLIDNLEKNNIKILILGITPISFDYPPKKDSEFKEKQRQVYKMYDSRIKEAAIIRNAAYIDLWELFESCGNLEELLCEDGLHPNEKGSVLIYEAALEFLEKTDFMAKNFK